MNSRTSNSLDLADEGRRMTGSRARRVDRPAITKPQTSRHGDTVRFMAVAALVSLASVGIVAMMQEEAPRSAAATAATAAEVTATKNAAPMFVPAAIDHGTIAPDAPSAGDAETVEASIAAYER